MRSYQEVKLAMLNPQQEKRELLDWARKDLWELMQIKRNNTRPERLDSL